MELAQEDYTRFYIEQALFKLMDEYAYERISVTDIAQKAGVGRATFYRYFKRKEDVINYFLEHNTKEFIFGQQYRPRCKADYKEIVKSAFSMFRENRKQLALLRKARLEYLYLDYLNRNFVAFFQKEYTEENSFTPYLYAGMLFNVSIAWLDDGCKESVDALADMVINAIYFEQ